jgi:hypothetical protein
MKYYYRKSILLHTEVFTAATAVLTSHPSVRPGAAAGQPCSPPPRADCPAWRQQSINHPKVCPRNINYQKTTACKSEAWITTSSHWLLRQLLWQAGEFFIKVGCQVSWVQCPEGLYITESVRLVYVVSTAGCDKTKNLFFPASSACFLARKWHSNYNLSFVQLLLKIQRFKDKSMRYLILLYSFS